MSQGQFRFVFHTKDYESTVAFYQDGLELPILRRWDRGPDDQGVLFGAASGVIEVLKNPSGRRFIGPQGGLDILRSGSCGQLASARPAEGAAGEA
jgi:catechol 2,3-dioxygenase-like lactoylglutathione lyase family enzyme